MALRGRIKKEKGCLIVIRGAAHRKSDKELVAEYTASFLVEK